MYSGWKCVKILKCVCVLFRCGSHTCSVHTSHTSPFPRALVFSSDLVSWGKLCGIVGLISRCWRRGARVPRYRLWVCGPTSKFCIAVFPYGCESREFHQLHIALLPQFLWVEVGSFIGTGNTLYGGILIIWRGRHYEVSSWKGVGLTCMHGLILS